MNILNALIILSSCLLSSFNNANIKAAQYQSIEGNNDISYLSSYVNADNNESIYNTYNGAGLLLDQSIEIDGTTWQVSSAYKKGEHLTIGSEFKATQPTAYSHSIHSWGEDKKEWYDISNASTLRKENALMYGVYSHDYFENIQDLQFYVKKDTQFNQRVSFMVLYNIKGESEWKLLKNDEDTIAYSSQSETIPGFREDEATWNDYAYVVGSDETLTTDFSTNLKGKTARIAFMVASASYAYTYVYLKGVKINSTQAATAYLDTMANDLDICSKIANNTDNLADELLLNSYYLNQSTLAELNKTFDKPVLTSETTYFSFMNYLLNYYNQVSGVATSNGLVLPSDINYDAIVICGVVTLGLLAAIGLFLNKKRKLVK